MRVARKHPNEWLKMNAAERLVQRSCCGFTWSWMNSFVRLPILEGMYKLACEVIRLRAKVRKLEKGNTHAR